MAVNTETSFQRTERHFGIINATKILFSFCFLFFVFFLRKLGVGARKAIQ